ncbi:unnamed protein product [Nesidiocoris tenuis]|uniref:Beta-1,4-N-acetylgalactosaminyltransferase n=1 Tax=Nesidiocoris tenuis TaxID=355587 RepID=A0A6H5GFL1_9HEMI|nr:unnamed protein product [Nesidiocoris tenuis]
MSAIDKEIEEAIDSETLAGVSRGGTWIPDDCTSRHSVAIIIPYRDREKQLNLLMKYLPPVLKRHQINYSIFVVEQMGNETFNKGVLMNAGFLTALDRPANGVMYHCFIFHDVDLLPEDDRNMYTCPPQPRHLSVAVNELHYKLPYRVLVGGVFAVRTEHFLRLNGYSNLYWGWGGEDDDMGYRVEHVLSSISRPPEWVARYTMIKHEKRRPLSRRVRTKLLRTSWRRYRLDGLNTVSYGLGPIVQHNHYTHVMIDVGPPPTTYRNQTALQAQLLAQEKRILESLKVAELNRLNLFERSTFNWISSHRVIDVLNAENDFTRLKKSSCHAAKPYCPKVPPRLSTWYLPNSVRSISRTIENPSSSIYLVKH